METLSFAMLAASSFLINKLEAEFFSTRKIQMMLIPVLLEHA